MNGLNASLLPISEDKNYPDDSSRLSIKFQEVILSKGRAKLKIKCGFVKKRSAALFFGSFFCETNRVMDYWDNHECKARFCQRMSNVRLFRSYYPDDTRFNRIKSKAKIMSTFHTAPIENTRDSASSFNPYQVSFRGRHRIQIGLCESRRESIEVDPVNTSVEWALTPYLVINNDNRRINKTKRKAKGNKNSAVKQSEKTNGSDAFMRRSNESDPIVRPLLIG